MAETAEGMTAEVNRSATVNHVKASTTHQYGNNARYTDIYR